jgi:DNA-binding NarL/FixJ family response regulator
MNSDQSITVGIVDDHQVFTEALALVLGHEPDFQVVGLAGGCAAARGLIAHSCPDVLLLDVSLPDGDGLGLVPEIKALCPTTHILVLTALSDEKTLMRAIDTGVSGFVGKNRPVSEVLAAIRQAAEGEIVMPASLLVGLLARVRQPERSRGVTHSPEPLTTREQEILLCLAQGMSSNGIASQLNISPMTVRTHIRNLNGKLGVHSRLEAVTYALHQGLIELPI